jgi:hemolysin-activating ACP:hemolysin acyltransferase
VNDYAQILVDVLDFRMKHDLGLAPAHFNALRNSAYSQKLKIFRDQLGRPIGYIAWANINKASTLRLFNGWILPVYPYEWSEGAICLPLDVMITKSASLEGVQQLKHFLRTQRAIVLSKRNVTRIYFRKDKRFLKRLIEG